MTTKLTLVAHEEGTYVINIAWLDEDGNSTVPTSATWTLTDARGNVVNSRLDVVISSLATTNDVLLTGDDLALSTAYDGTLRVFLAEALYNSSLGSGLLLKAQATFDIENLVKVP